MSTSPTNLEIQGSFMRVPPPKEVSKSIERRQSSEDTQKPTTRRSITLTNRSSANTPASRRNVPTNATKIETKLPIKKSDDTETMKTKISNLEDEIRRLKRRIEELEKEIAELQKQVKAKDKRVAELTKENEELKKRELNYQKQVDEFRLENNRLTNENERLQAEVDRLQAVHNSANDSSAELDALREHYERQIEQMRQEHARELKIRDDKIAFLKKQISDSLKDNSWERQQQIEELTKQLKRTHDEYEILRQKLLQYQNKKRTSNCGNCSDMAIKIEEKTKAVQEKDATIQELLTLMTKFKSQISNQDEFMKLLSTYNNTSLRH
ncbi:unnamed protein product [Rotaria sordida]|uniref:Uncharacterized protein n=1 Tax=Rotaria sordida TaxID=392033 RepID=A0A814DIX2_9BILA|nr:unnamed protein product [Rotaria sordida]CAF0954308.1 unnamed protein product [Rotaria sordida]CAF0996577.1 unnamed protein product [Rotaria sordida]CAF1256725.1 unnamed protein product [Rotaria sordida]CAF3516186.1 unnamed protein product [Rotaria sordida]